MKPERALYRFEKRALDLAGALFLAMILSPILVTIWVLVRIKLGSPALFRQERAGLHGQPFFVLKFRTMSDARDAQGCLLPDLQRISGLGRFLRRSSLDELPQLWNVIMGDMSLVGPRPLYVDYVPRYSPEQRRRLDLKPGITGLAQISGRVSLDWDQRLRLDVDYIDQACASLDILILLRTVQKVLARDNVPSTGADPTPFFLGEGGAPISRDPREGRTDHR